MKKEDLKIGDKVRVKEYKQRPGSWNDKGEMDKWMGKEVTIHRIGSSISIEEDPGWAWNPEDFEEINTFNSSNERLICKR